MVELKLNPRTPTERRILKTMTLRESCISRLGTELKKAGYINGVSDINFSNLLSDLIDEFANKLNKENSEDEI